LAEVSGLLALFLPIHIIKVQEPAIELIIQGVVGQNHIICYHTKHQDYNKTNTLAFNFSME